MYGAPNGNIATCYVHIVESPHARDLIDGRTEGSALLHSLRLAGIPAEYHLAVDDERFREALGTRLAENIRTLKRVPIIHISAHGNRHGIQLTDGTTFLWEQLDDILRPIHDASEGQTMLCLSTCEAARGMEMAQPKEKNFHVLVGSTDTVTWDDSAVAFYHRLFKGAQIDEAVEAMKAASGHDGFRAMSGAIAALTKTILGMQLKQRLVQGLNSPLFSTGSLAPTGDAPTE
jgi:hypothetical protein